MNFEQRERDIIDRMRASMGTKKPQGESKPKRNGMDLDDLLNMITKAAHQAQEQEQPQEDMHRHIEGEIAFRKDLASLLNKHGKDVEGLTMTLAEKRLEKIVGKGNPRAGKSIFNECAQFSEELAMKCVKDSNSTDEAVLSLLLAAVAIQGGASQGLTIENKRKAQAPRPSSKRVVEKEKDEESDDVEEMLSQLVKGLIGGIEDQDVKKDFKKDLRKELEGFLEDLFEE